MTYVADNFDDKVVRLLIQGGVGFMPSDTIYGLSCSALNQYSVERLKALKKRGNDKAFIVLVSNIEMLDLLSIDKEQVKLAEKYWPGPADFGM